MQSNELSDNVGAFCSFGCFFVLVNLRYGVLFLSSCLCHYLVHSIRYYWTLHWKGIHTQLDVGSSAPQTLPCGN